MSNKPLNIRSLPKAGSQRIFNFVARHLLKQGAQAELHNGTCVFRSESGLKCAVGCLIPDSEYVDSMDMEATTITGLLQHFYPDVTVSKDKLDLLRELQRVHDNTSTTLWPERLGDVAKLFNLNSDIVTKWEKSNAKAAG